MAARLAGEVALVTEGGGWLGTSAGLEVTAVGAVSMWSSPFRDAR